MSESTPEYYNKKLGGVKADPYRICKLYGIAGGPHEHITKKMLRGVNKDDGINTELDLIRVVRGQLDRWEEMIKEDQGNKVNDELESMKYKFDLTPRFVMPYAPYSTS